MMKNAGFICKSYEVFNEEKPVSNVFKRKVTLYGSKFSHCFLKDDYKVGLYLTR